MNLLLNSFSSVWSNIGVFFKNSYLTTIAYIKQAFNFLVESYGFTIAIVQTSIVALLFILTFVFLIVAIINPKKRRKKKLDKIYAKQQEIEALRTKINDTYNEISSIDLNIALLEKKANDEIFHLTEEEKFFTAQENTYIYKGKGRIEELVQKQKVLNEYLKNQQSGIFRSMKKAEATKRLLNDINTERSTYEKDVEKRYSDANQRKTNLENKIAEIKQSTLSQKNELLEKRALLEAQKSDLKKRLNKLIGSEEHLLTVYDAKTISDEYAEQIRITDKVAEEKALEGLRRAKAEYEKAAKRRVQTEKATNLAIEHVKEQQKEREKSTKIKTVSFTPIATAVRSDDKPKDVNIIIADVNGEITDTYLYETEEPVDTELEVIEEHEYNEPTVEIVDMNNLSEEEVVFIEAILEDINFDEEYTDTEYLEVAVTKDNEHKNG